MAPQPCQSAADNVFGPQIHGCRHDFDFTLLFEQSILSILPSLAFMVLAVLRCLFLWRRPSKLGRPVDCLLVLKLLVLAAFGAVQIALVVLYATLDAASTRVSVAASSISLVVALAMAALSALEHHRSLRPSTLLLTYLLLSTLCDVCQARTLWLRHLSAALPRTFSAEVALRFAVLLLESVEKRPVLQEAYRMYAPEALGSIVNRSVLWWLSRLLLRGSAHVLQQEDLMPLDPHLLLTSRESSFQAAWARRSRSSRSSRSGDGQHALFYTTAAFFWKQIVLIVVPRVFLIGFNIAQPLLIYRAVSLLGEPATQETQSRGRALIGATALVYLGVAFSTGLYKQQTYRWLTMMRSALITLVYDASLGSCITAANDKAAITHISTDIDQIASGLENLDTLWAAPIELGLAILILAEEISVAVVAPVIVVIACTAAAVVLARTAPAHQKSWMGGIQARVAATATMLDTMKAIRMTGLADKYTAIIHQLRVTELQKSLPFRRILLVANVLGTISKSLSPVGAFVTYSLLRNTRLGDALTPSTVFSSLSLLMLLAQPLMRIVFVLPGFLGAIGCFDRIETFLVANGTPTESRLRDEKPGGSDAKSEMCLLGPGDAELVEMSSFKHLVQLRDATFSFGAEPDSAHVLQNLTASIDKNDLIIVTGPIGSGKSALLLSLLGETALVQGTMQRSPHLRFGYCAQDAWLPNAAIRQTILGPAGFVAPWYDQVIHACALEADLAQLPEGDRTLVGTNGIMLSGGQRQRVSLARALYANPQVLLLDDVTSGLDAVTEQAVVQRVLGAGGLCRTHNIAVVLASHKLHFRHLMDHVWALAKDGTLSTDARAARATGVATSAESVADDHASDESGETPGGLVSSASPPTRDAAKADSDSARQQGDLTVYLYYCKAIGWPLGMVILASAVGFAFMSTFPNVWLRWWSDSELRHPGHAEGRYAGVYAALGVTAVIAHAVLLWSTLIAAVPATSIKLHRWLLDKVMSAPLAFFVSTDSGVTVNRFGQDMSLLDSKLPAAMVQTLDGIFLMLATLVILAVSSKWTALSFPVLLSVMYALQKFYLRTSRQLRLLDLESRSSLVTSFLETMRGLVTIRAFGWESHFQGQNKGCVTVAQKPHYLLYSIQVWLNVMLDLILAATMVLTITLAMELRSEFTAGSLGLAFTSIASISQTLSYVIQSWTMMETSVGALMRVRAFVHDTPSEDMPGETRDPGAEWPSRGALSMKNLSVQYSAGEKDVLRDITLDITPGLKVGVCGRTGSGKSSLILSMLRMNDITGGSVSIDGQDLSLIQRGIVRRQLAALPQDPMLLDGTVRFNLDPSGQHSDAEIMASLADVELDHLFEAEGALGEPLNAGRLSAGQKQLLCIARVLLNRSRFLMLDETTSSVDYATEDKIISLVRQKFSGCTVIAVAHRLRTLMDFDLVLVLSDGRIVEQGRPRELLAKEDGLFRDLWDSQQ